MYVYCVECYCYNACGMVWLKPVATVLLMLCSAVLWSVVLKLCCDVWYVMCYIWKNHLLKCLLGLGTGKTY